MTMLVLSKICKPVLEAFVDVVEPLVMRIMQGTRLVAIETAENDIAFHRVSARRSIFLGNGTDLDEASAKALQKAQSPVVELRLLSRHLVVDELKIPSEAAHFAAQIVESRLDRLAPWSPSKLLYGFAVSVQPDVDGQIRIDFLATSLDVCQAAIERLQTFGLAPSRIGSAAEPLDKPLRIDLLRGENDFVRSGVRHTIAFAACVAFIISVIGFVAIASGAWLTGRQAAEAAARYAEVRQKVMAGNSSGVERDRRTAILAEKSMDTARFLLIDRLATTIPDDTYLDQLEIEKGRVRIAGFSTEASSLIAILEGQPGFSDAVFSAPVIRQEDGRDRFDITVLSSPVQKEPDP